MNIPSQPDHRQQIVNDLLKQKISSSSRLHHHGLQQSSLSFTQQRWWLLQEMAPGSANYNRSTLIRLTGELDIQALQTSLNKILARHTILQVEIKTQDGIPYQCLVPRFALELPVIDLSHLPQEQESKDILQKCRELARQQFKLDSAPLLRFYLFESSPNTHFLLLVLHHILFDAWSESVFIRDLLSLYESTITAQPVSLADLSIDYFDAIAWQQEQLSTHSLKQQLLYWTEKLKGVPAFDFPSDISSPPSIANEDGCISFNLSAALLQKLTILGNSEGCTPFMVMLSAYQMLLFRYTAQEDFTVNIPIVNRQKVEFEKILGPFLNTLILRSNINEKISIRELLRLVRRTSLEAFSNKDLPFEKLIEVLQSETKTGYQHFFKVSLDFKNIPDQDYTYPHLSAALIPFNTTTSLFDISLELYPQSSGDYLCNLVYNANLFSAELMQAFASHYQNILNNMVIQPDLTIGSIAILSPDEVKKILYTWNQTQKTYPQTTLPHLFESQAKLTPRQIALVYQGQSLTYRETLDRVNYLAYYLIQLGLEPGQFVLLNLDTSLDEVIALLAVMRARGVYVPVDPAYPVERINQILQDCQAQIVLTQSGIQQQPTLPGIRIITLDSVWEEMVNRPQFPSINLPWSNPKETAYMIYTSGSTGKPKGVMVNHYSLSNLFFSWSEQVYSTLPQRPLNISLNTLIAFDVSLSQIMMLAGGHTLHILSRNDRFDGQTLLAFIRNNQIDVFECVPAQLKLMLNNGLLDETEWLPHVIIFAGEAIDAGSWARICKSNRILFYNAYGPTECTVYASLCCANYFPEQPSIGRPLNNIRLYILDPFLNPLPPGIPGELYIGGNCVARGYYQRTELTSGVFISDPFVPGEVLYKTGDKVHYHPDGQIIFGGRTDYQIKRLGYRIEPGEIETALTAYPGILEALVVTHENTQGDKDLVAYLTGREGAHIRINELRDWLKSRLPLYMLPQAFVVLDKFPLLENGKLDRKSLPAPQIMENNSWDRYSPPENDLEKELTQIWAEVLQVERVGIDDDFFDLGGYSMLAVQLFARMQHLSPHKLPISLLFSTPTIRRMAESILQNVSSIPSKYVVPIQSEGKKSPLFAIPGSPGDAYFSFLRLAEHMGKDRPIYGLQINQMDENIPADLEKMAAFFIREIKSIQPCGPYKLMGYSWGGHLVYAMACLLHASGEEVAFLGLLDTRTFRISKIKIFIQNSRNNLHSLRKLSLLRWPEYFYPKIYQYIFRRIRPSLPQKGIYIQTTEQILFSRNKTAVDMYHYKKYSGPVFLFKTETDRPVWYQWEKYCKHLVVCNIPGNHLSIMAGPEIPLLAKAINQEINKTEDKDI